MMTYQQVNSTFIPKSKDNESNLNAPTPIDDNLELIKENKVLLLKVKEYEAKINELEKTLNSQAKEMHSYNNVIVTLEEEIKDLKDVENMNDFDQVESLNDNIVKLKDQNIKLEDQNVKLKEELNAQKEHAQLLYILMMIIIIM